MAAALAVAAPSASAQTAPAATATRVPPAPRNRIGPNAPVTYANKWEFFGGMSYMRFQGGQSVVKLMNLGGGEALLTYWVTPKIGLGVEGRSLWGTTPVTPNLGFNRRALVSLTGGLAGLQYRGPKNQYAALNYHAYFGAMQGVFNHTDFTCQTGPGTTGNCFADSGLYSNRTKPVAALGGSVDINIRRNLAWRFSPDLILEHFGTYTRPFFGISGGVVWRIGKH